ncbi:hypothetical protein F5Y02DRAFT_270795 [Annulohypoxylon stygium]|nr:hypothetical protein F5Y02DRAFT_270795 [Annulohypoxylon stygium]
MAPSEQKDLKTGKGSRGFDLGSIDALPNVDLAGGIFEAPGVISEPRIRKSSTGDSKKSGGGSGGGGGTERRLKDTAGAGAMIL